MHLFKADLEKGIVVHFRIAKYPVKVFEEYVFGIPETW